MNSYCDEDSERTVKFSSAVRPKVTGDGDLPTIGPDDEGKFLGAQNGVAKWLPIGSGSGNVFSDEIRIIKVLDRADYDALEVKDPMTLYAIRG